MGQCELPCEGKYSRRKATLKAHKTVGKPCMVQSNCLQRQRGDSALQDAEQIVSSLLLLTVCSNMKTLILHLSLTRTRMATSWVVD